MKEEPVSGGVWTSWVLPLFIVFSLIALLAAVLHESQDIPVITACIWATAGVLAFAGYFLGEFQLYNFACRKIGFRCEMRPATKPHSARGDADLVITGTFHGRPFTLFRERQNSTSTSASSATRASSPILWSVVEWSGQPMSVSAFTMDIGTPDQAHHDPFGIEGAVNSAVASVREKAGAATVSGRPGAASQDAQRLDLAGTETGSPAELSRSTRASLAAIMGKGSVEGGRGFLVLRERPQSSIWTSRAGKFPYPWEIEAYLTRAENMRRLFAH